MRFSTLNFEAEMPFGGTYVPPYNGVPISNPAHRWNKYYGYLSRPGIEGVNISCGVRQLYSLHAYPPLMSLLWGVLTLSKSLRYSQYVFSDIDLGAGGISGMSHTFAKRLFTQDELRRLQDRQPARVMAEYIEESGGVLGSVVGSAETCNRNTNNRIRTFVWTLPYGTEAGNFNVQTAIDYLNNLRNECEV